MMNRRTFSTALLAGAAASLISTGGMAANAAPPKARNVVLVHGLFADGSSWSEVIERLQTAGLNVTSVQNPLTTLPESRRVSRARACTARRPDSSGRPFLLRDDRHGGRGASERLGARLCGGASAGCGRGLRGIGQDISDASSVRRDCIRRR